MLIRKPFAEPVSGILSALSLVLTLFCLLLDGSSGAVGVDCAILTLNTSQIGHDLIHGLPSFDLGRRSNPLASVGRVMTTANAAMDVPKVTEGLQITHVIGSHAPKLATFAHSAAQSVASSAESGISNAAGDLAKAVGLYDFYSAHLLNFCEGYFIPDSPTNASVPKNSIYQNVTSCSRRSLTHDSDPLSILQQQLNVRSSAIAGLQLADQLTTGFDALRAAQHVVVGLYCVAIFSMSIAVVLTTLNGCLNSAIISHVVSTTETAAVLLLFISSTTVTIVAASTVARINKYGGAIGISATTGTGFLGLTWFACVFMTTAAVM